MKISALIGLCSGSLLLAPCFAQTLGLPQAWPTKPIRFIVNTAPAGPSDIVARVVGQKVSELLGQPVIVENRTGAGGNIATVAAAKSAPDGYTGLVGSTSIVANVTLYPAPGYDVERDLFPIAVLARQPTLIVVSANTPFRSLGELLKSAKVSTYAFATPGTGTPGALTGENLFNVLVGARMTPIHFRGAGPAVTALLSGEPMIGSLGIAAPLPHLKSGRLRALAVSSAGRSAALPDVPTLAESGFPGLQDYLWIGLFMPTGISSTIAHKLNEAVNRALQSNDVRERLSAAVFEPVGGSLQETASYVRAEGIKWRKVVLDTGAKPD